MHRHDIIADAEYDVWNGVLLQYARAAHASVIINRRTYPDWWVADLVNRLDEFERCLNSGARDCPVQRSTIADYFGKGGKESDIEHHRLTMPGGKTVQMYSPVASTEAQATGGVQLEVLFFSRVGFSEDFTQALLLVATLICPQRVGETKYLTMQRTEAGWTVQHIAFAGILD